MIFKIKKKKYFVLFTVLFTCIYITGFSQVNDAEFWENISVSKKITRNSNFHFNHEGRIAYNISLFHYAYGDFGITRNLTKHFKIEMDYVLVWKQTELRESWRHQWYTALLYKDKFNKRVELNLRSMYQVQYQDIYSSDLGMYPSNYLRNKITVSYIFNKYPFYLFKPYLALESYYHLDNNDKYGSQFDRLRYFAGVFYNFNRKTALELYYLIEKNFNTNSPTTNYVIGIGYEFDL